MKFTDAEEWRAWQVFAASALQRVPWGEPAEMAERASSLADELLVEFRARRDR